MTAVNLTTRQIINRAYKDICGFEIPKKDEQNIKKSKGSPVYGEINHQALNKLLDYLELDKKDVLYDLGSGVGKVVLHTALITSVKKAVGIELSSTRHKEAMKALERTKEWVPNIAKRCHFINGDLMLENLSDATVIYTCSTAFSQSFMKSMYERLASYKHKFKLITLQDLPSEKHFELIDKLRLDMSWCRNTEVLIYKRSKPYT